MVDEVKPSGIHALAGWFKSALGNPETRRLRSSDDGSLVVSGSGASGAAKDYYYATGGATTTVDIGILGGAKIAIVTLEGSGLCKVCMNAPNVAARDTWLNQGSSLTSPIKHRRLTPASDIDDRTFLVDATSLITSLSFMPDATITGISVRSI